MKQNNQQTTPIVLLYIYSKIRRKIKGNVISFRTLKNIITMTIIADGNPKNLGGRIIGLPKVYIYDIIKDLVNFSLIKKIDSGKYEINLQYEVENTLLKLNDFLKESRITGRFKTKMNELLKEFFDKISFKGNYEIIPNKQETKLKKFPY